MARSGSNLQLDNMPCMPYTALSGSTTTTMTTTTTLSGGRHMRYDSLSTRPPAE